MSRLIDGDALIEGYKHMGYDPTEHPEESYMEGWCKGFNAAVDHCMHHVIHAPTIEERNTGAWCVTPDGRIACSNCFENPTNRIIINGALVYDMTPIKKRMRYCPHCGARMVQEGEEP